MYEAEVNSVVESKETLPPEIRGRFAEFRDRIVARTLLPWGEHCTECVWPSCYTTCDLYAPRPDGNCRQFAEGMIRIDHQEGLSPYILKLNFKQWAKLWTVGNLRLHSISQAAKRELVNIAVGAVSRNLPLPVPIRHRLLRKVSYLRREATTKAPSSSEYPDYFLLECYNPADRQVGLRLTIRTTIEGPPPFQTLVVAAPGYTRATIPFAEISRSLNMTQGFSVEIAPNDPDGTVLYFGLMDFVKERREVARSEVAPQAKANSSRRAGIKCVVWDLDNTLWDGILVEDGPEKIRLRQDVVELIQRTDQKGLLHSIASKNNPEDALNALKLLNISEYFLYPQISWQPKSRSLADIANLLNIGIDAVAFVDDQVFEREEVKSSLPAVTVLDAADYKSIEAMPELLAPATAESRNRRAMYRQQEHRQTALKQYEGDYKKFLKDSRMEIKLAPLDQDNLQRVYELAQRTNQLNFSGNRYEQAQLAQLAKSDDVETFVVECSDRFGGYGIVGFAVVDLKAPCLLDLMFSCRVQGKRVEHAVLTFLLERYSGGDGRAFYARYRKTTKNAAAGGVFEELGFEKTADEVGGCSVLVFRQGRPILNDGLATIHSAAPVAPSLVAVGSGEVCGAGSPRDAAG
jgi:FkbH-like protein